MPDSRSTAETFSELHSHRRVDVVRFDTHDVDRAQRYDAWRDNMGVLFDVSTPDDTQPSVRQPASISAIDLGETVFARARAESQVFSRTRQRIAGEELGLILVQYFPKGGGTVCGRDRLVAGDMQIIDTERPYELAATDYENLTLMVPHDLRHLVSPAIDTLHGRALSGRQPMVRLLGEHLESLWRNVQDMELQQAMGAIRGTMGLMHGWLSTDSTLAEELMPEVADALYSAIRRYIEQNLDQSLCVAQLTRRFQISRAQLYRLFDRHNGISRYIWERRLQRSRRHLIAPGLMRRKIGAIAFDNGFRSEAHFSRAFRARFGIAPRDARSEALIRHSREVKDSPTAAAYPSTVRNLVRDFALSGKSAADRRIK